MKKRGEKKKKKIFQLIQKNKIVSLYDYINSTGKHFYHIKSTPDISLANNQQKTSSQFSSLSNNINKINGLQNLNLNSITNNNTNILDNNSNTNRTSNKTIHFRRFCQQKRV